MKYIQPITHVDDVLEPLIATMLGVSSPVVKGVQNKSVGETNYDAR